MEVGENKRTVGARVISHPYRMGNGAAIKTGIRHARGHIMVMMDGDGQHNPADIPRLLEKIGPYDMAVGARSKKSQTRFYRDLANWLYNSFASYVCAYPIDDLTSGFRAIKSSIARSFVSLLPNTFSYPTTLTISTLRSGFSITYVPIDTSYRAGKSKIKLLRDGARFLLIITKIATLFSPMKIFVPVSSFLFFGALAYGLCKMLFVDGRYGQTAGLVMIMAVIVFMVGLVSEQVTQLRFDRANYPISAGLSGPHALAAVFIFNIVALLSSLFVGLFTLPAWAPHTSPLVIASFVATAIIGIPAVCTHSFWRLINLCLLRLKRPPLPSYPSRKAMLSLMLGWIFYWLVLGAGMFAVTHFLIDVPLKWFPLLVPAFSLACFISNISFIAPAGFGVREGLLIGMVGTGSTAGLGALFAGITRIVMLLNDAIMIAGSRFVRVKKPGPKRLNRLR